jgi:DNA polymerase III subunit beta
MKFKISREALLTPLQQSVGVVERRHTMAILSNILLRLSADGELELSGTDLEVQLLARTTVEDCTEGEVTVPARKFLDICRSLPEGGWIGITAQQSRFTIQCGRTRFSLSTLPAENYPDFDRTEPDSELRLDSLFLKKALEKTAFAMAQQDVRYYLNGLMLELDGRSIRCVASDGHRLAIFEQPLPDAVASRQVIIPRKGVLEMYRLIGDDSGEALIQFSPNNVSISFGRLAFSSKLVQGRYPDYQRVMPTDISQVLTVNKLQLKSALSRVSILSNEKFKGVSLTAKAGCLTLVAQNPEHEEAVEEIEVDYSGEDLSIAFNALYLLDAISNVDSPDVRLSFPVPATSCLVEDTVSRDFRFVVMPMRL